MFRQVGRESHQVGRRPGFHGDGRIADARDARREGKRIDQRDDGLFFRRGIKQEHPVALRERARDGREPGHRIVHLRLLLEEPRTDQQRDEQQGQRNTETPFETRQSSCRNLRHPLLRGHDCLVAGQDQGGQKRESGDQAAQDALREDHAQVGTDLQPHEAEHHQADDSGKGAAQDGGRGQLDGARHGLFVRDLRTLLLPVAVHQDDGVVDREGQLHDGRQSVGNQRNAGQQCIRPHVDQDGDAEGQHEQQHFDQRRAHHQQDQENQGKSRPDHQRDAFGHAGIVFQLHPGPPAETGLHLLSDRRPVRLTREIILVERLLSVPPDLDHPLARKQRLDGLLQRIGGRFFVKEHAQCLEADVHPGEILFQDGEAPPHLRIVGQVAGHVGIEPGPGNQDCGDNRQDGQQCGQPPAAPNQQPGQAVFPVSPDRILFKHSSAFIRANLALIRFLKKTNL